MTAGADMLQVVRAFYLGVEEVKAQKDWNGCSILVFIEVTQEGGKKLSEEKGFKASVNFFQE